MTVPRPALAELVPQFANDPSLYERGLTLVIKVDGVAVAEAIWTELVYDEETNGERYEIQQRVWRIGRGEGTAADFRAETIADHWRRRADDINRAPRWDE